MIDAAFGELRPLVKTRRACQLVGKPRATHYRRIRVTVTTASPAAPVPLGREVVEHRLEGHTGGSGDATNRGVVVPLVMNASCAATTIRSRVASAAAARVDIR